MLAVSFLQWWYTRGWGIYFQGFRSKMRNLADFFSIGLLLKTLFQPFKLISANESSDNGGLEGAFIVFTDKLVSRVVGFVVRVCIILAGIVVLFLQLLLGTMIALLWPCVPLLPFAGVILSIMGVVF